MKAAREQFSTGNTRTMALFATFSRSQDGGATLQWAVSDSANRVYLADSVMDGTAVSSLRSQIESRTLPLDDKLRRAYLECSQGPDATVPLPDRKSSAPSAITLDGSALSIKVDQSSLTKDAAGNYVLQCKNADGSSAFSLTFEPRRAAARQGANGIVHEDACHMFSYVISRLSVSGKITIKGETLEVTDGTGSYNRKFSAPSAALSPSAAASPFGAVGAVPSTLSRKHAWYHLRAHLDDGSDLDVYTATSPENPSEVWAQRSVLVTSRGEAVVQEVLRFAPVENQAESVNISVRSAQRFPTQWALAAAAEGGSVHGGCLQLKVSAAQEDQEFMSWNAAPSFWHGHVTLAGHVDGYDVKGHGTFEMHPYQPLASLDTFLDRIREQVIAGIEEVMPRDPSFEQVRDLLTTPKYEHFMVGSNTGVFRDTIIKPLRDIVDRYSYEGEGAAWRSFAMMMCIDAVGGNSNAFRAWMSMPELMHVGSLVVDDIQDDSAERRGGPASHVTHGLAIAINAGSAAYFMSLFVMTKLGDPVLDDRQRIRLYEYYFVKLRCGHTGQGFDIRGVDPELAAVVEQGAAAEEALRKKLLMITRLKMAVPASCLARMGALVGKGTEPQIEAIGNFIEAIAIASEIARACRQLKDGCKQIRAGKVPLALALAMSRLEAPARKDLHAQIMAARQPGDAGASAAASVAEKIIACGGDQAALDLGRSMVEKEWQVVDKVVPNSMAKLMLRSFSWSVCN